MIDWLHNWITGLTGAGILLAAALAVTPEGSGKRMVRFGGGLVLLIVLCRPFVSGIPLELPDIRSAWASDAGHGEEIAKQMQTQLIEERLSAYILSKGRQMGLDILVTAEAELYDGVIMPVRVGITLRGNAPVTDVETLTRWIEKECGIPVKNQQWTRR
jgi:hypothetical protein